MTGSKRKDFDKISVKTIGLKNTLLTVCQERNDAHGQLACKQEL